MDGIPRVTFFNKMEIQQTEQNQFPKQGFITERKDALLLKMEETEIVEETTVQINGKHMEDKE
jgi:hypothetical protein